MRIRGIRQPTTRAMSGDEFDLFVVASGFEPRATTACRRLARLSCSWTLGVVLAFQEEADAATRKANDEYFASMSFEVVDVSASEMETVYLHMKKLLRSFSYKEEIRVCVDITSMSRLWYGAIVKALSDIELDACIVATFTYIPAAYSKRPRGLTVNEVLTPVRGYSSLALPDMPSALVLGLGRDDDCGLGIREYIDPDSTLLFLAKPGTDKRYDSDVLKSNKDLLESADSDAVFHYPLCETVTAYRYLEAVCLGMRRGWRVVAVSIGPKIFGLYCFLISANNPDISVWRVSRGHSNAEATLAQRPGRSTVILETAWGKIH